MQYDLQIFVFFFNLPSILSVATSIIFFCSQIILLLGYGPDAPPTKLFGQRKNLEVDNSNLSDKSCLEDEPKNEQMVLNVFSWRPVVLFVFWALLWSSYVLFLCGIYVQQHGGLQELFKRFCLNPITYSFLICKWQYLDVCLYIVSRYFSLVILEAFYHSRQAARILCLVVTCE